LRFCQTTRLQFLNSHILLDTRCVLQQQHVDCKIADALLKRGTKNHVEDWDSASKDLTHMVLHLPHVEGGFGVSFNCVTKDAAFYTTTSRFVSWMGAFSQERQKLWLPKDDLRDSSSWSSSPPLRGFLCAGREFCLKCWCYCHPLTFLYIYYNIDVQLCSEFTDFCVVNSVNSLHNFTYRVTRSEFTSECTTTHEVHVQSLLVPLTIPMVSKNQYRLLVFLVVED
jgi:hypothetical protein